MDDFVIRTRTFNDKKNRLLIQTNHEYLGKILWNGLYVNIYLKFSCEGY